ncbi:sigma-70 family RNA polymerase sigma factor (plasmid) [Streptomyces sp. NEAU-sy36]|uniref:sigma-70 family RNA polymerase sigma factor n=1 Tax=unclassified Streptomyces TaxID=2593676 RepID=UPI0015D5D9A9|nr:MULTISPECIES: sigma-70 family RNA polymerase sigma factor [unclassified Streptomyces]QLJ06727.1 sigma-70 family RNA polymerase sigma factor [Streptomyces sp. NEAU-sy36]
MPPSKAKQALVAKRRSEMLIMKIQGRTAAQIAEHYGISPATARSDLARAIKKARELEVEDAELYRYVQGARLEHLLRGVWAEAVDGDIKAGEQARKYIADLTDLFGLKVPVRTEISGPDGGAIPFGGNDLTELSALIDIAGQPSGDLPDLTHVENHDSDDEDAEDNVEPESEEEDGDRE